ncbi:hypothetical protein JP0157_12220 [Helicobacter pylori]
MIKNAKLEIEKTNLSFPKDFHEKFKSLNNTQLPSDLSVKLERGIKSGINALSLFLSKNPVTRPFVLILQGLKPLLKDLLTLLPNIINSFFRNEEKAGPFISENAVIKTEELEKTIKGMQSENRGLKVGIIGRVKAGKSSLLNALIFEGKNVLPKAATPMTASLTILKYAQNLSASAQFYDEKDMEELKRDHEKYEKKFKEIVSEEIKKLEEKQQGLLNKTKGVMGGIGKVFSGNKSDEEAPKERILNDEEILKKAQKIAETKLKDTRLKASHDQFERMKKSGLINPKDLETRIQADSLEELNQKLHQFVGANGKYMPYTKAVQISLNNHNLKDLEIIDTPGVNDPIVSREECTKALLKECDVVFVISPSNQFLTDSDMDLFDRVSNKEGIQRVYEEKYPHQQEIFESAIKNGVILTSGICFSMYQDFEN